MEHGDHPWLHRAADRAAERAQLAHFCLLFSQLAIFFIVGVLVAVPSWAAVSDQAAGRFAIAAAIVLMAGLFISSAIREKKYEQRWFEFRAVAESAKKLAWRYVMRMDPFGVPDSDQAMLIELEAVRAERPAVSGGLAGQAANAAQITPAMRHIRARNWEERKAYYLAWRVEVEKDWYETRARRNRRRATCFYWGVFLVQLIALAGAVLRAAGVVHFNAAGLLMTLAASFGAWAQAKRYEELSTSYSIAAEELTTLGNEVGMARTEDGLLASIEKTEEAISREHTMWRARRSVR